MAYESLKAEIRQYIKTNGQNEITGQILQDVLLDMVNEYPSLSGYATKQWVTNQGYLTNADLSNYATKLWVQQQGYLTSHQSVDGTFWGQSWSNHGSVSGSISAGSSGGSINQFHAIELNTHGSLSGYGGLIDFHFNGSSSDYTSRIIEETSGVVRLYGKLQIGEAIIEWDSTNQCLKITGGLYSTSFISALGVNN